MVTAIITRSGEILYAALNHVVEVEAVDAEPKGTALGADFAPAANEPTPTPGMPVVGITEDGRKLIERLGDSYIGTTDPFNHLVAMDPDTFVPDLWFKDAHISRIESSWEDFGSPGIYKDYFEVLMTFDRYTRAYVILAAESDEGVRNYSKVKLPFGRQRPIRIPLKLFGTKIRIRLCIISFNGGRAILRDMGIGFNAAGDT